MVQSVSMHLEGRRDEIFSSENSDDETLMCIVDPQKGKKREDLSIVMTGHSLH